MMQGMAYEQGLRLLGTPLWFDAMRQRELCVLTGLEARLPPAHRRTIASAPLAAALQAAGLASGILPSPWRRTLGVAGLRLQLIDAAAPLGGAAALLEEADTGPAEGTLMLGLLRQQAASWPACKCLVARLPALLHHGQHLAAIALEAAQFVDTELRAGRSAKVWVDHFEVGVVLAQAMAELNVPVATRGHLQKLWRGLGQGAQPIKAVTGLRKRLATLAVARPPRPRPLPQDLIIDSGVGLFAHLHPEARVLRLQYFAGVAAVQDAVAQTGAKHLTVAEINTKSELALKAALGRQVSVHSLHQAEQLLLGA